MLSVVHFLALANKCHVVNSSQTRLCDDSGPSMQRSRANGEILALFCSVLFQAKIFPSDRKEQAELSGLRPQRRVMCGEGYLPPPAYWGRFWDFLKFLSKCGGFYACLMRKTTCGQKLGPGRCSIDPLGAKDIKRTEVKNLTRSSTPKLAPELEHISVRCHCHRC